VIFGPTTPGGEFHLGSPVLGPFTADDLVIARPMIEHHMPAPPEWLSDFANAVAAHVHPMDVLAPLGCHYHHDVTGWEITLFASRTEIVGGPRDGQLRPSRFGVDLLGLCSVFTNIQSLQWQAHRFGSRDEIGPHIAVEGDYCGQRIWLRVPAAAPEQFPPGRHAATNSSQWEEVW
jgi:hypothetical protein